MHITLRRGVQEYLIVGRHQLMQFHSQASARTFLQTFLADPSHRPAFREALGGDGAFRMASASSDHELLDQLAWKLARGELTIVATPHLFRRPFLAPPPPTGGERPMTPQEAEQAAKAARPAPEPPPPSRPAQPPPEPVTLAHVHEDTQADTLEEAAKEGVPFCEECEKARQRRAAKANAGAP